MIWMIIRAPYNINEREEGSTTLFLAGSIDNGHAVDWQYLVEEQLTEYTDEELTVFNPRRKKFAKSAKHTIDDPYFKCQVDWELDAMDETDYIFMYFSPGSSAPVSMLELGLYADSICKIIVCCPDGFWRQGNVEIVCDRFNVPFFRELDDAIEHIKDYIDCDQGVGIYGER